MIGIIKNGVSIMSKRTIIISGINLRAGGGLTILRDCLNFLSNNPLSKDYRIVALVHKRELADFPNIKYLEFPKSAKSWLRRLFYEYYYFNKISKRLKPYLWLSLHDISPKVKADRQAVYMHNPSIVNKVKLSDWKFDKTYIAFSLFYKYLYKINSHSNNYCVVQQNWFREICSKLLNIPTNRFIVAKPNYSIIDFNTSTVKITTKPCYNFFFPSIPRPFKNFETLCAAASILEEKSISNVTITLTLDGTENDYAKIIYEKYKNCKLLKFIGLLNKEGMDNLYHTTDCLIFPSRLETWGLPISEFLPTGKPMIIADEPYAHETSQGAKYVAFYHTNNANHLAELMMDLILGDYSKFKSQPILKLTPPFAADYKELFEILLKD